ncbi:MAG: hypothetical protein OIN87_01065 [Candidatus Methanoperedens sp.]|nr:hypothetical protein [Candidatus Methanoperedens sp.]
MDNEIKPKEEKKDASLENLQRMLEKLPDGARKPILDLIDKRKVELGLMRSELRPAGYILKKQKIKSKPKPATKESMESLRKIAQGIGKIKEKEEILPHDIDFKDEPLRKDKKALEEVDSYKY